MIKPNYMLVLVGGLHQLKIKRVMSLGSFRYNKGSWTTNYCGLRQSRMLRLGQSSIFKSLGSFRA